MGEPTQHTITDPDVIEAISLIAKDDPDGLVQPEQVVEAAQDLDSPLHSFFEWDEGAAAHQYRLVQARGLIVRVPVITVYKGPSMVNVKIVGADGSERRGYVPVERAVNEPDLCAQIMADARRGIAAYRLRLSAFEQARAVLGHLDAAIKQLDAG